MPGEFSCVQCGRPLQPGDAASGTRILCPACGTFSTVAAVDEGSPIEFRCTGCRKLLRTGADAAGKQAKCPECGRTVPVPAAGPQAAAAGEEPGSPFAQGGGEPAAVGDAENPYRAPAEYSPPPPRVSTGGTDPKAVASLVLGLCGFMLFCFCGPLSLPVAVTGLVLGIMGRNSESRGLAVAGIVLCAVQLVLAVVSAVGMIFFFMIAGA